MSAQIPLTKNVFVSVNIPVKGGLLCYAYCQRSLCVAGTGYECKLFNLLQEIKKRKKMFSDATFTKTTGRIRAHSSACTLRERRDHPTAFITVRLKPLLPRPFLSLAGSLLMNARNVTHSVLFHATT